MVSFVIVSHSDKFAEGIIHLIRMSAPNVRVFPAGGLESGDYGTSYDLIYNAVNDAYTADGVIVLTDMGSAVMTAEMVIEDIRLPHIKIVKNPIVEAAVTGTVLAESGADFDEIVKELSAI